MWKIKNKSGEKGWNDIAPAKKRAASFVLFFNLPFWKRALPALFALILMLGGQAAFSQETVAGPAAKTPRHKKCRESVLRPSGGESRTALRRQAERQMRNLFLYNQSVIMEPRGRLRVFSAPRESHLLNGLGDYLGRSLSAEQEAAIAKARKIGFDTEAEHIVYSPEQLQEKRDILEKAGFSPAETEKLMENGATAYGFRNMNWFYPLQVMFFQNFLKGNINSETAYFILKESLPDSSGNQKQSIFVGKVIKKISPSRALVEIIDGGLKTKELDIGLAALEGAEQTFLQGNSNLEMAFRALKSETKSVDFLPFPWQIRAIKQEAERLKALGYGPAFLRGFEEFMEMILLKRALIEEAANPYATHIEYFASKIPKHIAHVRRGIEEGGFLKTEDGRSQERLADGEAADIKRKAASQLESLEKQAAEKIQKKEVTYVWWLEFYGSLTKILSPSDPPHRYLTYYQERIKALINSFPSQLLMPSAEGEMGILAMNAAGARGIHPLGLMNKNTMADGHLMSPRMFGAHDMDHVYPFVYDLMGAYSGAAIGQVYLRQERLEDLPVEKRKNFETVYFLMFHQGLGLRVPFIFRSPEKAAEDIAHGIETAYKFNFNFRGLKNLSKDPKQRRPQIEAMARDFVETAALL